MIQIIENIRWGKGQFTINEKKMNQLENENG